MTRDEAVRIVMKFHRTPEISGASREWGGRTVDCLVELGVLKLDRESDLVEELCTDLNNKIHPPERWVPLAYMKDSLRILKLKLVQE